MLNYYMYFKLDLSFYMFVIIFEKGQMVKLQEEVNGDKYF
jgi:hypothetical protein